MGIWIDVDDSVNRIEICRTIAESVYVNAYCVGNEVLLFNWQDAAYLKWALDTVRQATQKPVTTAETWWQYLSGPYGDWLFRNCDSSFRLSIRQMRGYVRLQARLSG